MVIKIIRNPGINFLLSYQTDIEFKVDITASVPVIAL